ncbi:A/G-specific adenine glycosylase [Pseudokordiimonas caeni]|uniref:A/G-specific adenine glycosylase n=1 Tax=Pseudokordiimonas caeni TaxID=2997908 RepID=UPI0028109DCA|nr:A/G-specific adenine glycosylase [Pseudokordiimonas caeni]
MTPASRLLDWYDRHRRDLPWRAKPGEVGDAYHVWLSEVMLQQTTVATVKGYYADFLKRWPKVTDLANAPLEDVLKAWAGLGYYARARNLHKCAEAVARDHGGRFPATEAALRALPGVGDYTAAAVAAIAFGEAATVVDGNVERVISRLFRIETPLPKGKAEIKVKTATLVPRDRPGDFAQACMDLGSSICTPKNPKCLLCPLQPDCAAHAAGEPERFPVKAPKKEKPTRRTVAFMPTHNGHVLLERRPPKGLLGGMPGLYSTPWEALADFPDDWAAHAPATGDWQLLDGIARHTFTHFHLETRVAAAEISGRINLPNGEWVRIEDLDEAGLPTVFVKMVGLYP